MISLFGTIIFWTIFVLTSIPLFVVAVLLRLVTYPFDRRCKINHRFTCFWGSLYTWFNPAWRIRFLGKEKIPEGPCIFAANHQSSVDIFALMQFFGNYKWISKIENFKLPLIGWNMWLCKYIALKANSLRSTIDLLRACKEVLGSGESLFIFPEGMRSLDGKLQPFQRGAFDVAKRSGVSIVPVAISGSYDALPTNTIRIRGLHKISITFLEPIPADQVKTTTSVELSKETRRRIADSLGVEAGSPDNEEQDAPQDTDSDSSSTQKQTT